MSVVPFLVSSDAEIEACYTAFSALRPHLKQHEFLPQVKRQQLQSYRILAVKADGCVVSVAGFRLAEFLAWGKVLYIDDLSTLPESRGRGYGAALMQWLIGYAGSCGCNAVHLDTGYSRYDAHKLYLNSGLKLSSHHMSLQL
jgi:GNAT superfamily N-acetyltransferase